jgi:hypothetical protein
MSAALAITEAPATVDVLPLLLDLPTFARLLSVSERTGKRLAVEIPGLSVHVGRRLLFRRSAVEQWVERGCPRPVGRKRSR